MGTFRIRPLSQSLRLPNSLGNGAARLAPIGNLGLTKLPGSATTGDLSTPGDSVRIFPDLDKSTTKPLSQSAGQFAQAARVLTRTASSPPPTLITDVSIAEILTGYPSIITPKRGETRYPRLEALVDHLVGQNPSPIIIERGAGKYGQLAASVARRYPITLIEYLNEVTPNLTDLSPDIRAHIQLVDVKDEPKMPTADLCFWIHPVPFLMRGNDDMLNLSLMGKDVKVGGYLVIQTESPHIVPPSPEWEVVHDEQHDGFLATSKFVHYSSNTIVLRRTANLFLVDWRTLAKTNLNDFAVQVHNALSGIRTELMERLVSVRDARATHDWYMRDILPVVDIIDTTPIDDKLAREIGPWTTTIPKWLADGDLTRVRAFLLATVSMERE